MTKHGRMVGLLVASVMAAGCAGEGGGGARVAPDAWSADGRVSVESWYVARGGSSNASAWFASERPMVRGYDVEDDTCVAFRAGSEPWAPSCEETCSNGYCGADGQCHPFVDELDAGPIRIEGGSGASVTLSFDGASCDTVGCYEPEAGATPVLFGGGERVTVRAEGAAFPAFEGEVELPRDFAILTPAPKVWPEAVTVAAGSDLTFTWQGAGSGTISIAVVSLFGQIVFCDARDDGSFTIPWASLSTLPRGTNEIEAFLERRTTLRYDAGSRVVDVSAASVDTTTLFVEPG